MISDKEKADLAIEWEIYGNREKAEYYYIKKLKQKDGSFKYSLIQNQASAVIGKNDFAISYQPLPSERDQEFLDEFRYDSFEEAYNRFQEFIQRFPNGVMYNQDYENYLQELHLQELQELHEKEQLK